MRTARGAIERQLMAIFRWDSPKQAAHYTKAADERRLVRDAMIVEDARPGSRYVFRFAARTCALRPAGARSASPQTSSTKA